LGGSNCPVALRIKGDNMNFSKTVNIFTGSCQNPIDEIITFLKSAKENGATHLVVQEMGETGGSMRYDAQKRFTESELIQNEIADLEERLEKLKANQASESS
jgi:hypothetical protein